MKECEICGSKVVMGEIANICFHCTAVINRDTLEQKNIREEAIETFLKKLLPSSVRTLSIGEKLEPSETRDKIFSAICTEFKFEVDEVDPLYATLFNIDQDEEEEEYAGRG
jgi:hypothetical protein